MRLCAALLLLICLVPARVLAGTIESFQIVPNLLFEDDDVKVIFAARMKADGGPLPPVITLLELDAAGEKIRYRWPLTDDGTLGDLAAGDGIYSRKIQFKESRPKKISFLVVLAPPEGFEIRTPPPLVPPSQTGILEIRARPTFLEIMKGVFQKIWNRMKS